MSLTASATTNKRSAANWLRSEGAFPYYLIAPTATVMALIVVLPLISVVVLSFTNAQVVGTGEFVGFANYVYLMTQDRDFWRVVWQTGLWTSVTIGVEYVIALAIALLLNQNLRFRNIFRGLILLPWIVPPVTAGLIWLTLYADGGLFNNVLGAVSLPEQNWLGNPRIVLYSLMAVAIWKYLPFMIVGLLAGLQAIPSDMYEAAEIDGASPWQQFTQITFPMLWPVSAVLIILGLIWRSAHFDLVHLLTGGGPGNRSQLIATFAYEKTISNLQAGVGAAVAVLGVGVLLVLIPAFIRRLPN